MTAFTATPTSQWDRMRQELRGDKKGFTLILTGTSINLADEILKILAENGRHFGQLPAGEKLTVAIVFRPEVQAPGTVAMTGGSPVTPKNPCPLTPPAVVEDLERDKNHHLLGDFYLKSAKYQSAIDSNQKALKLKPPRAEMRELFKKIAQALLGAGKVEEAMRNLEQAQKLGESEPRETTPPLPQCLTISATKQQLDQVGGGKMSLEEFRRAATVEHWTPPEQKLERGGASSP